MLRRRKVSTEEKEWRRQLLIRSYRVLVQNHGKFYSEAAVAAIPQHECTYWCNGTENFLKVKQSLGDCTVDKSKGCSRTVQFPAPLSHGMQF